MRNETYGMNQDSIQTANRALVLDLIHREGVCSRAKLSQQSKLRQATITYIVNDLIRWGLVEETGLIPGSKGRRSIGVTIGRSRYGVLAVRLARMGVCMGIFDLSGACVVERYLTSRREESAKDVFRRVLLEMEGLLQNHPHRVILAAGVAVPGPFDAREEKIVLMTETMGWDEINIKEELRKSFSFPILMIHDARAGAWAQLWHNNELSQKGTIVYISAGQGIGCGILVNGEAITGSLGVAGEIGHMSIDCNGRRCECGNYGCLEKYCSSIVLAREVNHARQGEPPLSFNEIAQKVREGDALCLGQYERCCDYLAIGIVNVINCLNPNVISIGDEMAGILPETMLARVQTLVRQRVLNEIYENLALVISPKSFDAELYGASVIAIRDIFQHTDRYFADELE